MKKIKKIIAAIDFSIYSKSVLEHALALAEKTNAEILAVNMINKRDSEAVKKAFNAEHPGEFSELVYRQNSSSRRHHNFLILLNYSSRVFANSKHESLIFSIS
ncbi:MAG: universal stress protein [Thermodesulfobacteriota bacterium]|nr:universal stress protein [Thermodesulfobacteriota bacterium]